MTSTDRMGIILLAAGMTSAEVKLAGPQEVLKEGWMAQQEVAKRIKQIMFRLYLTFPSPF